MDATPATETTPTADATAPAASAFKAKIEARLDDVKLKAKELADRAKGLQAKAKDLPAEARTRALALVAKIREALDLPSRSEIAELTARLDRLDQRIAALSGGEPVPVAVLPEQTGEELPEQSRKDKKRNEAAKKARR
ncbi:MAG TPA: hypothetical protein VL463_12540 [Kofleriaceae bacterium]|jgi:hypothetical protein|nr:hypothetical protein [Kofleriaceae bacterium]